MVKFLKKNKITILILLLVTGAISCFYIFFDNSRNLINSIASILAIPSLIVSFAVLKVIDIKPENLEAYHRRRQVSDNEKKANKKRAKVFFDAHLSEVNQLNRTYKIFYNNIVNKIDNSKSSKNICCKGVSLLKDLFEETKDYIFVNFLVEMNDLGELQSINYVTLSIVESKDEELLKNKLSRIEAVIKKDTYNESDIQLLEELFGSVGLIERYIKTCYRVYEEFEEEKANEV